MSADVSDVLPRLAEIERELLNPISGLPVIAYDSAPFSLNSADLPAWVNLPGPAVVDWDMRAGEDSLYKEGYETRQYNCLLHIVSAAAGIPGEAFAACEPYFALGRQVLESHQSLKDLGGISSVRLLGDDGTIRLPYAGVDYLGIRFRLQIIGRVRVKIAQGE